MIQKKQSIENNNKQTRKKTISKLRSHTKKCKDNMKLDIYQIHQYTLKYSLNL